MRLVRKCESKVGFLLGRWGLVLDSAAACEHGPYGGGLSETLVKKLNRLHGAVVRNMPFARFWLFKPSWSGFACHFVWNRVLRES